MEDRVIIAGYVLDEDNNNPLVYTNISIRHRREGTISDTVGHFVLAAKMFDTIRFSMMGYERKFVVVDEKAADNSEPLIVKMTPTAYLLPMVDIYEWRYKQLKYEVETMELPDDDYIYAMRNFPIKEKAISFYDGRVPGTAGAIISGPISALYDLFSKEGKERRKLAALEEKDKLRKLIEEQISNEYLHEITGFSEVETDRFLDWCNFTADFVKNINSYSFIMVIRHKSAQYKQINKGNDSGKIYLE